MIKAVFFDFDLTLVNSRAGARASFKALSKLDKEISFKQYMGLKFSDVINHFHKKTGITKNKINDIFCESFLGELDSMKFYASGLFPKLKRKKIVIITYNTRRVVSKIAKHFGIKYDLMITDDDFGKNEGKHTGILNALKKFKLKKNGVLYVGDHIVDVIEAHKAGIKSVVVPTGVLKKIYIKKYHPDFMVSNINKISDLI